MTIKPCPFCGHTLDINDPDVLYPSGIYWYPDGDFHRYYTSQRISIEGFRGQPCYKIACKDIMGGCGAEMHGDSKQEVIDKWNRRV